MRLRTFLNEKIRAIDIAGFPERYAVIMNQLELVKLKKVIALLQKDCRKFINEIKPTKHFVYRGSHRLREKNVIMRVVPRTNRRPSDLHIELHNKINQALYDKFGWWPRTEGVFATFDYDIARGYGSQTCSFWPIGNYEYIYSQTIDDIFSEFSGDNYESLEDSEHGFKDDYWHKFDEGGKGHWEYDGEDLETNDRSDAIEKAKEIDINNDKPGTLTLSALEWVPEETEDEYVSRNMNNIEDELDDKIDDMIHTYKNKHFVETLNYDKPVEIMFKCKAYYLIHKEFDSFLYEGLFKGRKFNDLVTGWGRQFPHERKIKDNTDLFGDPF